MKKDDCANYFRGVFPHPAQITDWRLILYGTEKPPQPTQPINVDVQNTVESERSSDRWLNRHQVSGLLLC